MRLPYIRGKLFVILLISLISVAALASNVYSQETTIISTSTAFEETAIIEFENTSVSEVQIIRMWLGDDFTFKSFTTEKGWIGKKNPSGVIVFETQSPVKPGESVKIGIKTDKPEPKVNWRALGKGEEMVGQGVTLVSTTINENTIQTNAPKTGVLDGSIFKIIPEKPKIGNSIRVAGEKFGADQRIDFYIGNEMVESFVVGKDGRFVITTKIPENIPADRVDFVVKDSTGSQKTVSLRLEQGEDRMTVSETVGLTINNLPDTIFRGDKIQVSGTAKPDSTVTATIKDKNGNTVSTRTAHADSQGNWSHEETVSLNTEIGERTIVITDGTDTITRTYEIIASEKIRVSPLKLKFEAGDTIVFNGTAIPNQDLEAVLEDPHGLEFASQIIDVDSTGNVSFQFETLSGSLKGTYILFVSQGEEREIVRVGLGQLPEETLIIQMNKLNYKAGDSATIELKGPSAGTLSFLILDPSDKEKLVDSVILGPDGSAQYLLDLKGYASGAYSVVVKRGNSQTEETFTVGFEFGSGPINLSVTKDTYTRGETILVLGDSGNSKLLTLTLTDPDGNLIKQIETFTNKQGIFKEDSFRIPATGVNGTWTITAKSGSNNASVKFDVVRNVVEGLQVAVDKGLEPYKKGEIVAITGFGATGRTVTLDFLDTSNSTIQKLSIIAAENGGFQTLWEVLPDLEPGTYYVIVRDSIREAQVAFNIG